MLVFFIVGFFIFLIWCELGIGNILFRPDSSGKFIFLPLGWTPLVLAPFRYKEFWTTDLIMFNILVFCLVAVFVKDTVSTIVFH